MQRTPRLRLGAQVYEVHGGEQEGFRDGAAVFRGGARGRKFPLPPRRRQHSEGGHFWRSLSRRVRYSPRPVRDGKKAGVGGVFMLSMDVVV